MTPAKKKPAALGDVLAGVLQKAGIAARVEQAGIIPEWSSLVGAQIANVTRAAVDRGGRHAVRARDDERVDDGAVDDGARAAARAECEAGPHRGEEDPVAASSRVI